MTEDSNRLSASGSDPVLIRAGMSAVLDSVSAGLAAGLQLYQESESLRWEDRISRSLELEKAVKDAIASNEAVIEALRKSPLLSKHLDVMLAGPGQVAQRFDLKRLIVLVAHQALSKDRSSPWSQRRDAAVEELLTYLSAQSVEEVCLAPIIGLKGPPGEYPLAENVLVSILAPAEALRQIRDRFAGWGAIEGTFNVEPMWWYHTTAFLVSRRRLPKWLSGGDPPEVPEMRRRVTTAFHLHKAGRVSIPIESRTSAVWSPMQLGPTLGDLASPPHAVHFQYEFSESDVADVARLVESLYREETNSAVAVALRWFGKAKHEWDHQDRLVDLIIAAEALLLCESEREEMSYKFAERGAILLSASREERFALFFVLKEAYHVRSRIVHGSRGELKPRLAEPGGSRKAVALEIFVDRVEELVRRLLSHFHRSEEHTS